jgi:hypothetical protein
MDLRYLTPIKAPTAVNKKAHSLTMSKVNNGRAVTPSLPVSLPFVTTSRRNKAKAKAI